MQFKKYKNIAVFKSKPSDNPKAPTHTIEISVSGDYNDKVQFAGSLWTRDSTNGKFLSGSLANERQTPDKNFHGYVIVDEQLFDKLVADYQSLYKEINGGTTIKDYPKPEDLDTNPDDIGF